MSFFWFWFGLLGGRFLYISAVCLGGVTGKGGDRDLEGRERGGREGGEGGV